MGKDLKSPRKRCKNSKHPQNNLLLPFTCCPCVTRMSTEPLFTQGLRNPCQPECLYQKANHNRYITNSVILLKMLLNTGSLPHILHNLPLEKIHSQSLSPVSSQPGNYLESFPFLAPPRRPHADPAPLGCFFLLCVI